MARAKTVVQSESSQSVLRAYVPYTTRDSGHYCDPALPHRVRLQQPVLSPLSGTNPWSKADSYCIYPSSATVCDFAHRATSERKSLPQCSTDIRTARLRHADSPASHFTMRSRPYNASLTLASETVYNTAVFNVSSTSDVRCGLEPYFWIKCQTLGKYVKSTHPSA